MEKAESKDQIPKPKNFNPNLVDIDMLGQKPRFLDPEKTKEEVSKLIEEVKGKPIPEKKEEKINPINSKN